VLYQRRLEPLLPIPPPVTILLTTAASSPASVFSWLARSAISSRYWEGSKPICRTNQDTSATCKRRRNEGKEGRAHLLDSLGNDLLSLPVGLAGPRNARQALASSKETTSSAATAESSRHAQPSTATSAHGCSGPREAREQGRGSRRRVKPAAPVPGRRVSESRRRVRLVKESMAMMRSVVRRGRGKE
jgi:hypothetical protein